MSDVGLHRADIQPIRRRSPVAVRAVQRRQFDRITQLRAGAVSFHVVDRSAVELSFAQRFADQPLLSLSVRGGQSVARTVVIDRRRADARQDRIAVAPSISHSLEHDDATALAADVAIGRRVERLAAAIGRERVQPAQRDRRRGRQHQVHAASQRQVTLARLQRLTGLIDRHQRRRTGRINLQDRPVQAEHIGDPTGRNAPRGSECSVSIQLGKSISIVRPRRVIVGTHADEDAGFAATQTGRRDTGLLERFPDNLQQQPLLRIELFGFARSDPKERGVELVHRIDEAAVPHIHLARRVGVAIEVVSDVPTLAWNLTDRVATPFEQPPKRIRRIRTRKSTAHADDGDVSVRHIFNVLDLSRHFGNMSHEMLGQSIDVGMRPKHRRRNRPAEPGFQVDRQLNGFHRIKPQIGE